jgi:hypothetical protein
MSFWAACVITNFFSAIPYLGPDLVEFIWGGFSVLYSAAITRKRNLKILFYAKKSLNKVNYFKNFSFFLSLFLFLTFRNSSVHPTGANLKENIKVKILIFRGLSAGVENNLTLPQPPRVTAGSNALQRLNTGDLFFPYLVGLVEGDGFFTITKNGLYIQYEFGIELNSRDIQLLYKIKDNLGVGTIRLRKRITKINKLEIELATFKVKDKSSLINVILPLFDKYPMLSNKQYDFLRFKNILLSNTIKFNEVPVYTRPSEPSLYQVEDILNVPYFSSWLIGFIEAEGCFSIYQPSKASSSELYEASFDISQKYALNLIIAIQKLLSFTVTVTNLGDNNYKLKVSSVRYIENVIKFLHHNPVKLLGYKRLQYILWLKKLRTIPKYSKKIDIPQNY